MLINIIFMGWKMKKVTKAEYEHASLIKNKIKKYLNVAITIACAIAIVIIIIVKMTGNMSNELLGILLPSFLSLLCLMNIFAMKDEKRKGIMILYIVILSICLIVLFFDIIYFNVYK